LTNLNEQLEKVKTQKEEKNFEEAISLLEKLYEKNPKEELVKKELIKTRLDYAGYLNDEFVMEYKKALETLKKLLDIDPENYRALYNLGITYHNLGQNKNALDSLNKALEIKPDYKYCYYNIGLIYEDMNEIFKALKAYTKALKIDKNFSYAAQAKREMQQLVDSYNQLEIPIIEMINEESKKKLKDLLKMSKRIKIDLLEEILDLEKQKIMDLVIEWGNEYQFELDGEYLVINEETLPYLLEDLE